jgi:hypothetical protein
MGCGLVMVLPNKQPARLPSGALRCILAAARSLFSPALATTSNRGKTL